MTSIGNCGRWVKTSWPVANPTQGLHGKRLTAKYTFYDDEDEHNFVKLKPEENELYNLGYSYHSSGWKFSLEGCWKAATKYLI